MRFRENWHIFLEIWGEAELFLGVWGAKANTFRETRKLFAGRRGDQCIIFRDQGSTAPPPLGGLIFHLPHDKNAAARISLDKKLKDQSGALHSHFLLPNGKLVLCDFFSLNLQNR